ncbi:hypothetical protein [Nocardioides speluncae]|uniref:hypothetical protein n=1 Tax=Nocardioides speluncae TaxID=2670337 RepID=UPI000D68ED98|nr:hypothetical protein [Nocardioides speluncae]
MAIRERRVRVWFGEHVVADYVADWDRAALYAEAMSRRFAGLQVTNEPVDSSLMSRPVPSERLWELVP